ncbi:MAG: universal stress protein [Desulfobacteraceae bacterium]|jgi:hypothetical protein|nr:universal stress protein [Desulfobacteraceae bacterium]
MQMVTGSRSRWHIGKYSVKNRSHRLHFLKGDPAARITDLAAKERIDLIVVGTVCRTGVAVFFIGNTAENVLQQVECSVLTVKPEGFVSPVKLKGSLMPEMPREAKRGFKFVSN